MGSTSCCKELAYTDTFVQVGEGSREEFTFVLDSSPQVGVTVFINVANESAGCTYVETGRAESGYALPPWVHFPAGTVDLQGSFVLRGTPGCYNISLNSTV